MEGISHEACSLAGTWGLNKLIAFWDDNGISIDGHVEGWFTDDTPARFEAYGWQVIKNVNGHDPVEVATAIATAQKEGARPTLICCKTTIGFGAPTKQARPRLPRLAAGRGRNRRRARRPELAARAVRNPGRDLRRVERARQGRAGRDRMEQAL